MTNDAGVILVGFRTGLHPGITVRRDSKFETSSTEKRHNAVFITTSVDFLSKKLVCDKNRRCSLQDGDSSTSPRANATRLPELVFMQGRDLNRYLPISIGERYMRGFTCALLVQVATLADSIDIQAG
jgi:hypothetical protein